MELDIPQRATDDDLYKVLVHMKDGRKLWLKAYVEQNEPDVAFGGFGKRRNDRPNRLVPYGGTDRFVETVTGEWIEL